MAYKADYVVVGAGSSGCIVAARLSRAGHSVVLLEAGDPAESHPETLRADGFKDAFANDALMWHRMSSPTGALTKPFYMGSGKGAGGSGSVNGMVYTRGDKADYQHWPQGWQWEDVLPYFLAVEDQLNPKRLPATPFLEQLLTGACASGFRRKDGLNDGDLAGFIGCNDMNHDSTHRNSSYRKWLHDASPMPLTVLHQACVQRLTLNEQGSVISVEFLKDGQLQTVTVGREVVMCAGALETPRVLMLSGIGPQKVLESAGIKTLVHAPGVGEHLKDHPNVALFFKSPVPVDFSFPQLYGFEAIERTFNPDASQAPDTCFVAYSAPSSLKESMLRMLPILALPGVLYRQAWLRNWLRAMVRFAFLLPPVQRFVSRLYAVVVILGKPVSTGRLYITSPDPSQPAVIDPGYYDSDRDRQIMLAAIAKATAMVSNGLLSRSQPLSKPAKLAKTTNGSSQDSLWQWVKQATMTTCHYCGTCRMGEDEASPVDTRLRLKGTKNIRIADASVMPDIPVSAINAPTMMIAMRASEWLLKGEHA